MEHRDTHHDEPQSLILLTGLRGWGGPEGACPPTSIQLCGRPWPHSARPACPAEAGVVRAPCAGLVPALVFLALHLAALIKTIFLSRHTYYAPWPQYRTLAAERTGAIHYSGGAVSACSHSRRRLCGFQKEKPGAQHVWEGPLGAGQAPGKPRGTGTMTQGSF